MASAFHTNSTPVNPKPPDPNSVHSKDGGNPKPGEKLSFAAVAASMTIKMRPRFPPIVLPTRQVSQKEGKPAISFTKAEVSVLSKRFNFSLIAKFTVGRPSLREIQEVLKAHWDIRGRATISEIFDGRHVLIILDSEDDVRTALSSPIRKIGHAFFRLFRWEAEYNPKREPPSTTAWLRLPNLPVFLYDTSVIEAIVSTFAYFVDTDARTKACTNVKYARVCVELNVRQEIPDSVWINLPNDQGYWQIIEVETKLEYCSKCRIHGHTLSTCRKIKARHEASGHFEGNLDDSSGTLRYQAVPKPNRMNKVFKSPITDEQNKGKDPVNTTLPFKEDNIGEEESVQEGNNDQVNSYADCSSKLALVVYEGCADLPTTDIAESSDKESIDDASRLAQNSIFPISQSQAPVSMPLLNKEASQPIECNHAHNHDIICDKAIGPDEEHVIVETTEEQRDVSDKSDLMGEDNMGLRRSVRIRHSTNTRNQDFVYHSDGRQFPGRSPTKVRFKSQPEIIIYSDESDT